MNISKWFPLRWRFGVPFLLVSFSIVYISWPLHPTARSSEFNFEEFAKLPLEKDGQILSMDTLARTSLRQLHGRNRLILPNVKLAPTNWLLQLFFNATQADQIDLFAIDNTELREYLRMDPSGSVYVSYQSLMPLASSITDRVRRIQLKPLFERTPFENALMILNRKLMIYRELRMAMQVPGSDDVTLLYRQSFDRLREAAKFPARISTYSPRIMDDVRRYGQMYKILNEAEGIRPIPLRSESGVEWTSLGRGLVTSLNQAELMPAVLVYATLGDAYRGNDSGIFNKTLRSYTLWLKQNEPLSISRTTKEYVFNVYSFIEKAGVFYLLALSFSVVSKFVFSVFLENISYYLLWVGFWVHTIALAFQRPLTGWVPKSDPVALLSLISWPVVFLVIVVETILRQKRVGDPSSP